MNTKISKSINDLCEYVHEWAKSKGWWDTERNDGEILCLMHSEISEALEGHRHGDPPSEHIPNFTSVEEEMADVMIRVADYCHARGFRLGEAIEAKMEFNEGRPYRHGKKF